MNSIFNRIHSNAMHMGATVTGESIFLQNSKCNPYEFPSLMGFIRQKWITNRVHFEMNSRVQWGSSSNEWCTNQPSSIWAEFPHPMGFTRCRLNAQPSITSSTKSWQVVEINFKPTWSLFSFASSYATHSVAGTNSHIQWDSFNRVGNSMECSILPMVNCE